jgi:type II secretory pathway component PulK
MTRQRPRRNGLAIIPALVCLALIATLGAALLRLARVHRVTAREEERRMQTEWLAESGIARAGARLATDRDYNGETWEIRSVAPQRSAAARIAIAVERVDGHPSQRRVRVVAEFPRDDEQPNKQTRSLTVDLKPESSGGPS